MGLNVGCVPYLNALPFYFPFKYKHIATNAHFTLAIPSILNQKLARQELDLALTSSVAHLDNHYPFLPGLGIAAKGAVLSVNLYTRHSPATLSGKKIGLTHHSATSSALLKVLCRHLWHVEPTYVPLYSKEPLSCYDAFLLIGDEALLKPSLPTYQTIDLGSAWYELTGLPFVFALFSISKKEGSVEVASFHQELRCALNWSLEHATLIDEEALKTCTLPLLLIRNYFSRLYYQLGSQEQEGLNVFKQLKNGS